MEDSMSIQSVEHMTMIMYIGIMLIAGLFSVIIGIITVIVSNKMKMEGKKDAKTWFYISIYCFATGGLMLLVAGIFALLPSVFFPDL